MESSLGVLQALEQAVPKAAGKMAIKGISKEDADHKIVPLENLNKISLGKGYARISNKSIVEYAGKVVGSSCINRKFPIQYDDHEQLLIIDLSTDKEVSL